MPVMHDTLLSLLLPILFIAHNFEEMSRVDEFQKFYCCLIIPKFRDPILLKRATVFLAIFVVIVIGLNALIEGRFLEILSVIIFLAILINTLQHIATSIWHHKMLPGAYTALFLILPYSIFLLLFSESLRLFIAQHILILFIAAYCFMVFAIYLSLACAYLTIK